MEQKYYQIEEAAKIAGCSLNDLIHFGAIGELKIHVLMPGCMAKGTIWSADPSEDWWAGDQISEVGSETAQLTGPFQLTKFDISRIEAQSKGSLSYVSEKFSDSIISSYSPEIMSGSIISWQIDESIPLSDLRLVVMVEDMDKLTKKIRGAPHGVDKPLNTTERNTLLTIIAALCNYSDIKHQERGAAGQIAKLTVDIGAEVSEDTILTALKKIPNALETRMK